MSCRIECLRQSTGMPDLTPWSLQNCGTDEECRKFLISFWLAAPYDHIEQLWSSSFGENTKRLIKGLNKDHIFLSDEVALRSEIGNKINQIGLKSPSSHGLMIANFLLSPPGLLKINNVADFFPKWLIDVYFEVYEPSVGDQNNVSLGSEILLIILRELLFQRIHWNLLCRILVSFLKP